MERAIPIQAPIDRDWHIGKRCSNTGRGSKGHWKEQFQYKAGERGSQGHWKGQFQCRRLCPGITNPGRAPHQVRGKLRSGGDRGLQIPGERGLSGMETRPTLCFRGLQILLGVQERRGLGARERGLLSN